MARKTILIVDDDPLITDLVKGALEEKYDVLAASSCSGAEGHFNKAIDLAIIAYALPDGDGCGLLKQIRAAKPELPVILITGYSCEDVLINALRAGATDFIKKPLNIRYVLERVSGIFEGRDADPLSEIVGNRDEFIMDCIALHIEQNYRENLTLDKLANMAAINKFKFCKLFRERIGKGFVSYLNDVRIGKAADLMKNHDLNITEIATHVGYKHVVHFERVFKLIHGVSPREYRKEMKQGD